MLEWGNGCLWRQTAQRSLRLSLSQCGHVSVISCLIFLSLFFHSSVTMTAGWVAVMTVNWELNWKRGVWYVCGRRQLWATHFAKVWTKKELWLTAIERSITLKLFQVVKCLHYFNADIFVYRLTSAVTTADNDVCLNPICNSLSSEIECDSQGRQSQGQSITAPMCTCTCLPCTHFCVCSVELELWQYDTPWTDCSTVPILYPTLIMAQHIRNWKGALSNCRSQPGVSAMYT